MEFESNYSRIESIFLLGNVYLVVMGLNRTIVGLKAVQIYAMKVIRFVFESNYSRIESTNI